MVLKQQGCYTNFKTILPRSPLIKIYKSFIRTHLGYGDIVYDQDIAFIFIRKQSPFSTTRH